jgi:hypothetical protein
MKYIYTLFISLLFFVISNAQIVDIPDLNFLNALIGEGVDTNGDGDIQVSEAEATLNLNVSFSGILSVEGIQSFINLVDLNIRYNDVSEVDISSLTNLEVLQACGNNLSEIDVSQNLALITLSVCINDITSIDVTAHDDLVFLSIYANELSEIDVTNNPNLEWLYLTLNHISNIDVTQNPNLTRLHAGQNLLTNLDVSLNPSLEELFVGYNEFTILDLSNQPNLTDLGVQENNLEYLNLNSGGNLHLENMMAYDNPNLFCISVDDVGYANSIFCDQPNFWGWCKDSWAEYNEECELRVEDNIERIISIYPNPVKDFLRILNTSSTEITKINIYDVVGRLVLTEKGNDSEMNLSNLDSGLLFVKINTDQGIVVKKIIKQ